MSALRERAGAEARRLLGGDEYLHVFRSQKEAWNRELLIPGTLTWAPRRPGWGAVRDAARERRIPVSDRIVVLEHEGRAREIVLDIAAMLYDRGAVEVKDFLGGVIEARRGVW